MLTNTNKKIDIEHTKHSILWGAFLFLVVLGAKQDLDLGGNVSFTLQTLVLGIAFYFLPRNGRLSLVLTYLILGVVGLPVFNGGAGWDYFISWPLGFFVGFLSSALLPFPKWVSYLSFLGYFLLLHAIVLALGATWLAIYTNSLQKGIQTLLELVPGAIIKSAVGALFIWIWTRVKLKRSLRIVK